jgi:uncharacterized protein YciI
MSRTLFVVHRSHGLAWARNTNMRSQPLWDAHALYMDDLTARGIILLAGPLEGTPEALLIFDVAGGEAEVRRILEEDPWTSSHQLETKSIQQWSVLLEARTPTVAR